MEFVIKLPGAPLSPHPGTRPQTSSGNKVSGDEGGTALFLAAVGPEGAPEQAGRQNHPPTWEPENFRAFRPSPGQANTDTSVSLPTSAFKPGGGRHLLSGRRLGLRCLRGPRPRISCIDLARYWAAGAGGGFPCCAAAPEPRATRQPRRRGRGEEEGRPPRGSGGGRAGTRGARRSGGRGRPPRRAAWEH